MKIKNRTLFQIQFIDALKKIDREKMKLSRLKNNRSSFVTGRVPLDAKKVSRIGTECGGGKKCTSGRPHAKHS